MSIETPIDISNINDPSPNTSLKETIPDAETKMEEMDYEKEAKKYNAEISKLQWKSFKQDIKERKKYANKIYDLISWWLFCIGMIVFLQGFLAQYGTFNLSDKVLIALITGTTINVLGLFIIVINYLFKSPK